VLAVLAQVARPLEATSGDAQLHRVGYRWGWGCVGWCGFLQHAVQERTRSPGDPRTQALALVGRQVSWAPRCTVARRAPCTTGGWGGCGCRPRQPVCKRVQRRVAMVFLLHTWRRP